MNKDGFSKVYVGRDSKCENTDGWSMRWNATTVGLTPTSYFKSGNGDKICCYCSNDMLPICKKDDWEQTGYKTIGYCCTCKDAEKEANINQKIKDLKEKMKSEIWELEKTLPKENYKKLNKHIQILLKNHKKDWFDESFFKDTISYTLHVEGQED